MYSMILPVANAKVFVDQIFRIFDKDGNGDIDFKVNYAVLLYLEGYAKVFILSQKYAFIKKSTIFTQSLRNFVKIRYS